MSDVQDNGNRDDDAAVVDDRDDGNQSSLGRTGVIRVMYMTMATEMMMLLLMMIRIMLMNLILGRQE